jgi:hypothetical protein
MARLDRFNLSRKLYDQDNYYVASYTVFTRQLDSANRRIAADMRRFGRRSIRCLYLNKRVMTRGSDQH